MSRVHMRGGPWTNAEDEVLKVALAKYGLRDWERVASMLTKKTAAQCRERWENYLDPRLNLKEAWSPVEEESLVKLQSLFPNQWRLISNKLTMSTPARYIRPPWLCEQHYLEIRDAHEYEKQQQQQSSSTAEGDAAPPPTQTLEEFMRERRQRRVAYQAHEEKSARADTVDGDRFQEEMLTMAVSRLANQDQKKSLRKERERKLEEASFLAKLESNRESIESGTLSARQEKLMRRALEEDRKHRKRSRGEGDDAGADAEDSEEEGDDEDAPDTDGFKPLDVLQDRERAGAQKKARTLVMDLGHQQESITARSQAASSAAAGVNTRLLDRLTGASSTPAMEAPLSGPLLAIDMGGSKPFGGGGGTVTTWDALAGPSAAAPNLDDLFATLPSVVADAKASGGGPAPADIPSTAKTATTATKTTTEANLSPARPLLERNAVAQHAAQDPHAQPEQRGMAEVFSIPPSLPTTDDGATAATAGAPAHWSDRVAAQAVGERDSATTTAERATPIAAEMSVAPSFLAIAKELVTVETERLAITARRRQRTTAAGARASLWDGDGAGEEDEEASEEEDEEAVSAEDVAMVRDMLKGIPAGKGSASPSDDAALGRAVAAAQAEMQFHTHINATTATLALEAECGEAVRQVNAALASMEARVERIATAAFRDPTDKLLLPYVSHAPGNSGDTVTAPLLLLLPYLKRLWESRCEDATQRATFLSALRRKEQEVMASRLEDAQRTLTALQQREAQLQALYRQRGPSQP